MFHIVPAVFPRNGAVRHCKIKITRFPKRIRVFRPIYVDSCWRTPHVCSRKNKCRLNLHGSGWRRKNKKFRFASITLNPFVFQFNHVFLWNQAIQSSPWTRLHQGIPRELRKELLKATGRRLALQLWELLLSGSGWRRTGKLKHLERTGNHWGYNGIYFLKKKLVYIHIYV